MGTQNEASGLYKTIVTMLVESGALYAASFALLVGPWASKIIIQLITLQTLPEVQVREIFSLPRPTSVPRCSCLTMMSNSASLRFSSFFGSPTGLH